MNVSLGKPAGYTDRIVERRVRLIRQIPGFCDKNLSVIDVGCGNGATLSLLAGEFRQALGVDVVGAYEEPFRSRMHDVGISNTDFKRLDIDRDGLPGIFDRLICFEVIEHLPAEETVRRLAEMLRPGGEAVISVPNKWWIFETHGADLPLLPWNRVPFFSWLPKPIHERWARARIYTRRRILRVLSGAGFTVLDTRWITAPLDVLSDGMVKRLLAQTIFRGDTTQNPLCATSIFIHTRRRE